VTTEEKMNLNYDKTRHRSRLRIFSGSSHNALSKTVAKKCGVSLGQINLDKFANNETSVDLKENVRGQNIYVIQTGGGPQPNDDLMELLFMINALKLSSAEAINVIIPYFFYSKGDQKDSHKRVPITAKLITTLLKKAGASHVMIIEPHTPQLEGFFETPVDALKVEPLFCNWIRTNIPNWQDCVVVAPDEGSVKRCTSVANDLNLDFALINNRRPSNKTKAAKLRKRMRHISMLSSASHSNHHDSQDVTPAESDAKESLDEEAVAGKKKSVVNGLSKHKKISISGKVSGRRVIVIDDMIDTGHTFKDALETLRKFGALGVHVMATHGLFSGNSISILNEHRDFIQKIVISNTVPVSDEVEEQLGDLLFTIDISGLIAEYIRRHHYHESVQVLCHWMPIPGGEAEPETSEEESSDESDIAFDMSALNGAAAAASETHGEGELNGGAEGGHIPPRDLRLMHLRKGFRLTSMCWDEQ